MIENKIEILIIIILAILVAYMIATSFTDYINNKLSNVIVNQPPIHVYVDKNGQVSLNNKPVNNEFVNNEFVNNEITNESINNINQLNQPNQPSQPNQSNKEKVVNKEGFGEIPDYPDTYEDKNALASIVTNTNADLIINEKTKLQTAKNPNYNSLNNIPLLVSPDTDVPNAAKPNAIGYYKSKVKLVNNDSSPLMQMYKNNLNEINKIKSLCAIEKQNKIPEINGTFAGYNAFNDLRSDSYANLTSLGKNLIVSYDSFAVPS